MTNTTGVSRPAEESLDLRPPRHPDLVLMSFKPLNETVPPMGRGGERGERERGEREGRRVEREEREREGGKRGRGKGEEGGMAAAYKQLHKLLAKLGGIKGSASRYPCSN